MDKKSIRGTRTEQNLLKSFAGESQARNRYTIFADVAREEGYEQIAAIFMETAEPPPILPVRSPTLPATCAKPPPANMRNGPTFIPSFHAWPAKRDSP